jgi:hypothetical protein
MKMLEDSYENVQSAAKDAIIKLVEDGKKTFQDSDTSSPETTRENFADPIKIAEAIKDSIMKNLDEEDEASLDLLDGLGEFGSFSMMSNLRVLIWFGWFSRKKVHLNRLDRKFS